MREVSFSLPRFIGYNLADIITINNFLRFILQSSAVVACLAPIVYYPVKTRLDKICDNHSRDCEQLFNEAKALKLKISTKVDESNLGLRLDPLARDIIELKTEIKDFRQEIIKILTNKIN